MTANEESNVAKRRNGENGININGMTAKTISTSYQWRKQRGVIGRNIEERNENEIVNRKEIKQRNS